MKENTREKITYEPPRVITYNADKLIEEIGPATACSFGSGGISCA